MNVRKLDTTLRRDVRQWVQFPHELYRHCSQWVPMLEMDAKGILNRKKHFFYRESDADFFVVEKDGKTLGRIAAMDPGRYNCHTQRKTAFFGFFEVVEDVNVARALFDVALGWARERDLTEMVGPQGMGSSDPTGALVKGFEHRPALGMPYNFAYYDELIRDSGFQKESDHFSGYLRGDHQLDERYFRIAERVKTRRNLWVKSFETKKEMKQWIPRVAQVVTESFAENPGFYPPSEGEVAEFGKTIITLADPQTIKLVMEQDRVVGFLFAYHDVSAGLQRAHGRLFPFGWFHILMDRRQTRWLNINGLGVLPTYQGRGASILLYTELSKTVAEYDFEHVDVVQVAEENIKSRSDMESIGVQWYKCHRKYHREI